MDFLDFTSVLVGFAFGVLVGAVVFYGKGYRKGILTERGISR